MDLFGSYWEKNGSKWDRHGLKDIKSGCCTGLPQGFFVYSKMWKTNGFPFANDLETVGVTRLFVC